MTSTNRKIAKLEAKIKEAWATLFMSLVISATLAVSDVLSGEFTFVICQVLMLLIITNRVMILCVAKKHLKALRGIV